MANKATATPTQSIDDQIVAKRAELLETKRSHAAGELVNPRALGRIRKEIARLHTQKNASVTTHSINQDENLKKGAAV